MRCFSITHLSRLNTSSISTATNAKNNFVAMSSFMTDCGSLQSTDIKALHHPDGREIDVKSLLRHVKDIILFTNGEQEEPRTVTSKEVKVLLVPLEKLMRDISKRDNTSAVAVSILKELLPYAWGAKAVLVLSSFVMNHGLWMLAQMYSASPPSLKVKDNKLYSVLSRVLSKGSELDAYYFYLSLILSFSKRPKENTLPKATLTSLFQAIVQVVECIIELQDLASVDLIGNVTGYVNTLSAIPIIAYNVITVVIYCAAVINQFPNNDYEISEAEDNELSLYASQINQSVKDLSKLIKDCNQSLEETKYDTEYQIPIPETSSMDNREALEYLIKSGDDPKLLNAADTIITQLKWKYVMLLVSDENSSTDEIYTLDQICGQITSQQWLKERFSILWIPLYSGIGKERAARDFETQTRNMNWYAVPHPSMVSKEAHEFIKNKWRFQSKSNIMILDPLGTILNINAFHMLCIWGRYGYPLTRSRERALWRAETFGMAFILAEIYPTTFQWIRDDKYIFLYGGDDIEWIRKFTTSAKRVSQKFNIPVELLYVGKPSEGVHKRTTKKIKNTMTNEGLGHVFLDETITWFFWRRLRSMLISKMSHQNRQESEDWMTRQLKWLLGYETERSWALLAKGKAVVTHGPGSTILEALMEYETKKVDEYGGSFEDEFEKLHKKIVSSGRVCCQVEFPVLWSSGMPETMRCPQPNCKTDMMDKSIVFECCHHNLLPEK